MLFDVLHVMGAFCFVLFELLSRAALRFLLQSGKYNEDMIPTVGFNMRKVTKGNVTIKVCAGHLRLLCVCVCVCVCV